MPNQPRADFGETSCVRCGQYGVRDGLDHTPCIAVDCDGLEYAPHEDVGSDA